MSSRSIRTTRRRSTSTVARYTRARRFSTCAYPRPIRPSKTSRNTTSSRPRSRRPTSPSPT
eukprot:5796358-Prymnesium_polylepis.1